MEKLRRRDPKVRSLILLLWKLRFKSAKPGLVINFANADIKKPGWYATTKVTMIPTMGAGAPLSTGGDAA